MADRELFIPRVVKISITIIVDEISCNSKWRFNNFSIRCDRTCRHCLITNEYWNDFMEKRIAMLIIGTNLSIIKFPEGLLNKYTILRINEWKMEKQKMNLILFQANYS